MDISKFPISALHREKLISAGYTSIVSLPSVAGSRLDLNILETEAVEISDVALQRNGAEDFDCKSRSIMSGAKTAWDMLHEEESAVCITTSCSDLDDILGGGIHCREVTEIGGVPGIGKTQIGIQLAINVQIPSYYGGLGGKAVYIDTEGSFMIEHALQIAKACAEDMLEYSNMLRKYSQARPSDKTPNEFLDSIFYFRVCTYTEQIELLNYLDEFITDHTDVKVVIIDTIASHFRQDFEDRSLCARLLGETALKLMNLARKFKLAVKEIQFHYDDARISYEYDI